MNRDRYTIKDATIWTSQGRRGNTTIVIENGKLIRMEESCVQIEQQETKNPQGELIDASGFTIIPAGVDPQVHLRVPGQTQKETAKSGLEAARAGGIAALLTMPNTKPVIDDVDSVKKTMEILDPAVAETGVTVKLSAAITKGQNGKEVVDFDSLAAAGVSAFTDDGVGVTSDDIMATAFAASERTGLPILQHAEYPGHKGVLAAGPLQASLGLSPYPAEAEWQMVERDLRVLRNYPLARYHLLHASCHKSIELIAKAKAEGYQVSVEVSPHHLWFSSEDIKANNSAFKMNPPLREQREREALRRSLLDGSIDFIATDHAPHEPKSKSLNFKVAAFGTTGLETSLAVLLSLNAQDLLPMPDLIRLFARNPAAFLGIEDRFGDLAVGKPFNAVLFDPLAERHITDNSFTSKSKNSCFIGETLKGQIKATFFENKVTLF